MSRVQDLEFAICDPQFATGDRRPAIRNFAIRNYEPLARSLKFRPVEADDFFSESLATMTRWKVA